MIRRAVCKCLCIVLSSLALGATGAHAVILRLMLDPKTADGANAAQLQRLTAKTGYNLWPQSLTRTGAYEIELAGVSQRQANLLAQQLREDSSVLWVEAEDRATTKP